MWHLHCIEITTLFSDSSLVVVIIIIVVVAVADNFFFFFVVVLLFTFCASFSLNVCSKRELWNWIYDKTTNAQRIERTKTLNGETHSYTFA